MGTIPDWPVGRPRAIHLSIFRPSKTVLCHPQGGQSGEWNEEYDKALIAIKQYLAEPPVLASPEARKTLFVYLAVSDVLVSDTLFKEDENRKQRPIFFVTKSLADSET